MSKQALAAQIEYLLRERAQFTRPLSALTTWKVGGPAWCVARVNNIVELIELQTMLTSSHANFMLMGMGSNLLFANNGFDGVVICLDGEFTDFSFQENLLSAGAGVKLSQLVHYSASVGWRGLEWAAGIPASVGGAIAMNAGSWGSDMASILEGVTILLPNGEIMELKPGNLPPASYRNGGLPAGGIVLRAIMKMMPGTAAETQAIVKANLAKKQKLFPLEYPNAGSVFKNPPGDFAGRLIEAAGLKGNRLGNAQISDKHANFIVNLGNANADDIWGLIQIAKARVQEMFAVELETEIIVVPYAMG